MDRYVQSLEEHGGGEEARDPGLSFLRWVISNTALKSDSPLLKLADYAGRMAMMTVGSSMGYRPRRLYDNFFESREQNQSLKEFEEFLNIMGIECKLIMKKLPDGQRELYFDHNNLVPFFENASSGTLALMNMYRRFAGVAKTASFLYIDEFDAFFHFEMSENVIKYLKKTFPNCQIILTSHNTNLMTNRLMRPEFIDCRRKS